MENNSTEENSPKDFSTQKQNGWLFDAIFNNFIKFLLISASIILLLLILIRFPGFMMIVFGILFIFLFFYPLLTLLSGTKNENSVKPVSFLTNATIRRFRNSEKHACKCYMEELTDGERVIALILAEGLDYKKYYLFNNITVPSNHNGSSQIDHLIISKFGIFVIESKDYSGWIFGNAHQKKWTQTLVGNKYQFQNPLRQNYSHIIALKDLLVKVPLNYFHNLVLFTDSSEFKTESIQNVMHASDAISYIERFNKVLLSDNDVNFIIGKMAYVCQTSDITVDEHVYNIKKRKGIE